MGQLMAHKNLDLSKLRAYCEVITPHMSDIMLSEPTKKHRSMFSDISAKALKSGPVFKNQINRHVGSAFRSGRKSTSGYVSGGPISWSSKRQSVVTTSTTEAEYIDHDWWGGLPALCQVIKELGCEYLVENPTTIGGDNNVAELTLTKDPVSHSKAKCLDIEYYWQ